MKQGIVHKLAAAYFAVLCLFTAFVLLLTFVIPRRYQAEAAETATTQETAAKTAATTVQKTDSSYTDGSLSVSLNTYRVADTTVYVADITAPTASLKTALADNTYGRNITETTSDIAAANNAVIAVNGDYYGARDSGYVIRNGVLYRATSAGDDREDLVIYKGGSVAFINEGDITAEELLQNGAWQVLSFGPALIKDGAVSVSENNEVGRSMASNPRTAVAVTEDGHWLLVVSDGRTSASAGLSLYELAEFLQTLGVKNAYNLDGGGSSTMVFCGSVVNNPTTNGKSIKERSVSDIVYFG